MDGTTITADLGGSPIGEQVTVVITGAPCRLRKAVEAIQRELRELRQGYVAADAKPARKPCGCDEHAG